MPWCPKCNVEYRDGFVACADCGSELTDQNPGVDKEEHSKRRSCFSYGCMTVLVVFVLLAAWTAKGFIWGNSCRIPLPDHSGSVVYIARLERVICSAEWARMVRIETNRYHGVVWFVPGDYGGADPVNVYWYPRENGSGPYLKFVDPYWEYMVDLKQGKTMLILRWKNGPAYAGEISTSWPKHRVIENPDTLGVGGMVIDGRKAHRLNGTLAMSNGTYIGRVEYPFNSFIPKAKASEKPLPKH